MRTTIITLSVRDGWIRFEMDEWFEMSIRFYCLSIAIAINGRTCLKKSPNISKDLVLKIYFWRATSVVWHSSHQIGAATLFVQAGSFKLSPSSLANHSSSSSFGKWLNGSKLVLDVTNQNLNPAWTKDIAWTKKVSPIFGATCTRTTGEDSPFARSRAHFL